MSRQFVWSALHSYPFYNSEQQSQRYVKLGEPKAYVPPIDGEARAVFERAVVDAWESYARLSALLKDDTFRILKRLRNITPKASPDRLKALEKEAEKKAIETARYVIPLAAFTAMVHTISGITLYRLMRMAQASDTPHEAREVIGAMVEAVRRHDPAFVERVDVVGLDADDVVEQRLPRAARRRRRLRRALRPQPRRQGRAARRLVAERRGDRRRRRARRVRRRRRRSHHRRRARSPAEPGPQSRTGWTPSRSPITRR